MCGPPGSSTNRAPGICAAVQRAPSSGRSSSARCRTSVGHADRRQHVTDVDLRVHLLQRDHGARARAQPLPRRTATGLFVGRGAALAASGTRSRPPRCPTPSHHSSASRMYSSSGCRTGSRGAQTNRGSDPYTTSAAVRSGYVAAKRMLIGPPSEAPTTAARSRAGRVHHRAHVVHPRLEVRDPGDAIRRAGAALVEDDQPAERRRSARRTRRAPVLPEQLDVRDAPGHVDEVERPVADDLVGDADVAAPRVARLGLHGPSLAGF